MRSPDTQQHTTVYSFGNLAYDLSLYEKDRAQYANFTPKKEELPPVAEGNNVLAAVTLLLGAALGIILLIVALLGQSRMDIINDQANTVQNEIHTLREENAILTVQREQTLDLRYAEQYAAETLGMRQPGAEQIVYTGTSLPDKATVLHIRREKGLEHIWNELIDTVGECFH